MLGPWEDAWGSQATDPRRAAHNSADSEAKRRRLESWSGFPGSDHCPINGQPAHLGGVAAWQPPLPPGSLPPSRADAGPAPLGDTLAYHLGQSLSHLGPFSSQQPAPQLHGSAPASADDDITARIVDALKSHLPGEGPASLATSLGAVAGPPVESPLAPRAPAAAGAEPELSARLLDSLRTLLPAGENNILPPSEVGQELFRVVQQGFPLPVPRIACKVEVRSRPRIACKVEDLADAEGEPIRLPPANFGALPPEAASLREDDVESDDGVPHRLPPGFGAIPEDIVEERARQREEERVLRLKATQPCRFGRRCKRRDCPNAHPEGRDIDSSLNPCAFGRRCKRKGCFYDHPEGRVIDDDPQKGMCKFGKRCSRPDCLYDHPDGRAPLAGPDPRICYFCHDTGHIATDCQRNPDSWNYSREAVAAPAGTAPALEGSTAPEQKAVPAPV